MGTSAGVAKSKLVGGKRINIATGAEMNSSVSKDQSDLKRTSSNPTGRTVSLGGNVLNESDSMAYGVDKPRTSEILKENNIAPVAPAPKIDAAGKLGTLGYTNFDAQELAGASAPATQPVKIDAAAPTPTQNKYQTVFDTVKDSPAPIAGGEAAVSGLMPPPSSTSLADSMATEDEFFTNLQAEAQDYFSPRSQRESLVEEYQKMMKSSGIEKLDMELLNMKNVIDGSEDDIRNEITKAGGFASDSQVLALTNSRNKVLIKNYNTLLETRNSKEQYLDKMMDLTVQDRQNADADFDRKMNFAFKIQDYKEKMKTNAMDSLKWTASQPGGFQAIQQMASNPYYAGLIDKTFGGVGALNTLATFAKEAQSREIRMDEAQLYGQQLQNQKLEKELNGEDGIDSQVDAIYSSNASSQDKNGAAITAIIKNSDIGQGTKTQLANTLGVINALEDLAEARQTTGFKGVGPLNRILDLKVPFTDSKILNVIGRDSWKGKESNENAGYLEAINLKVQQWASGASLTKQQTEQVDRFTPRGTDTDNDIRTKANNLANFMMTQAKSQLQSEGVKFEPEKVNLFEIYELLQEASPEQIEELKAQKLI